MIATAILAVATMAAAQAKPDFSGTWTPDPAANAAPAGGGAPGGGAPGGGAPGGGGGGGGRGMMGPITVKQTADSLTIERAGREGNTTTTVYKLDGTETDMQMGQGTAKVSAKWSGNNLVITQKTEAGESTQTWSLNGGALTIERTGGRGNSKTVYKKGS
jgi:hypothetical protein